MQHIKTIAWWLSVSTLACFVLIPVARSNMLEAIARPPAGFLMFPMVFVAAPVSVTPGVPGP